MSKFFSSKLTQNVFLPLVGFGVGWGVYQLVDDQVLSEETKRRISLGNLKAIRLAQKAMPASLVEKYGYPPTVVDSMISSLEKGYTEMEMKDRVTFDDVLKECDVEEQICYLEEHATEDIPYFYIADLFHSWASIHRQYYVSPDADTSRANLKGFESPILCTEIWQKMENGIIPFDVSVRALCVLAATNRRNAKDITTKVNENPNRIPQQFQKYIQSLKEKNKMEGDTVALDEVTAATLLLLNIVNDTRTSLFGWRNTPLIRRVDTEVWCESFGHLPATSVEKTTEAALMFTKATNKKFKCMEKSAHE